MESHITATEAARTFSDLLNRVLYRGETFVVERGGQPICRIVPARAVGFKVRDLMQLWNTIPKPDREYWNTLEEVQKNQALLPEPPWER